MKNYTQPTQEQINSTLSVVLGKAGSMVGIWDGDIRIEGILQGWTKGFVIIRLRDGSVREFDKLEVYKQLVGFRKKPESIRLPTDVNVAYLEALEMYRNIKEYEAGFLSERDFVNHTRAIKDKHKSMLEYAVKRENQ